MNKRLVEIDSIIKICFVAKILQACNEIFPYYKEFDIGMGIVLFLAWLMVIVAFVFKMRLRSFLLNALIVSAVFTYFVPKNINYSREHGDTTLQETIRATGQKPD